MDITTVLIIGTFLLLAIPVVVGVLLMTAYFSMFVVLLAGSVVLSLCDGRWVEWEPAWAHRLEGFLDDLDFVSR